MMTFAMLPARLAVAVFAVGLTLALAGQPLRADPPAHENWAVAGYDPVAYFTQGVPQPGLRAYALKWRGAIWLFATPESRAAFEADPAAYLPQFGGHCVVSVSDGHPAPGDPRLFVIRDGRLYLLGSAEAKARLAAQPDVIARAQAAWRQTGD
ncbi:hypothetical protein CCR83_02790 [Rhodobacter veldkampii DSM 11550]|uniref:YHS domain-containing protein n=1 Tax=Phaeovulum veldkampii DSM 11550 TaxID=1185920 RepID=A0A2T4JK21_9RHOB|nr:YHS domain-containing (seleno)protein [Phaeovulum veldkampii]MBK5945398.1 hypothetical protein [Phaeovulum veldkampii DSM 11550]NCU20836.1 hypothetical protein [Candidatus Falkowbacteria bacterium]PTE18270.1 hypothetical protein C5F46_04830 [Phaeovulum veldkampii DSM 11550]TDQ57744.1 hypothetical protein EV658_11111 [Phaeovulum veldkampii DSM 11550]